MDDIREGAPKGVPHDMDDGEIDGCDKIHINVSQNMDNISESFTCVGNETKEDDLHIDDINTEGIYHLSGNL